MNLRASRIAGAALALAMSGGLRAADVVTVDDNGSVGQNSSIAVGADGLPIIAYYNGGNGELQTAKCTAPDCSTAVLETVEDAGGTAARGQYISLAVRGNGDPVIAWYDDINDDLGFARCPNPDCSGDDILRTLDASTEDTGREASLALDADGRVHVAYVNTTQRSLQLARCALPACIAPAIHVVDDDPVNSLGTGASMALGADGFPVIAYLDVTSDEVLVAKCSDVECSAGVTVNVIDPGVPSTVGGDPDLAIGADGNPVISYFDEDDAALKVAHCTDPACDDAPTITLIDDVSTADNGRYSAIAIRPDHYPVIAYQHRALGGAGGSGLRVAECTSADCSGEVRLYTLDFRAGEISGVEPDVAIGSDGGAAISYYDTTTTSLKLAKCSTHSCIGPSDRIFYDGFQ